MPPRPGELVFRRPNAIRGAVRVSIAKTTLASLEQAKLLRRYGIPAPALLGPSQNEKPHPPGTVVHDKDAL